MPSNPIKDTRKWVLHESSKSAKPDHLFLQSRSQILTLLVTLQSFVPRRSQPSRWGPPVPQINQSSVPLSEVRGHDSLMTKKKENKE